MLGRLLTIGCCLFPALTLGAPPDGLAVLHERCIQCHASKTAMSGLAIDSRESLVKGGTRGPAVVPGDAGQSLIYRAIARTAEPHMPPTGKLADAEIAAVREWIDAGAEWSLGESSDRAAAAEWWAFRSPEKPEVPAGATKPVDAFLAERMRAEGLQPAERADRATLIRRASFDLLGLPPSYEDVRAFVSDPDPDAYPKLIDRLLTSEHYGEKWGRHWLDLVRYGDSSGFEQDPYTLEAYRYRDYVIKSFNEDKPYDRFILEQIAADEIFPDEPDARVGSGYYRVNANRDMLYKVEDLNRVEKLTDYVDTTSKVFLALSVGCARCHDHKFDPIPQKDFYRMQAIFAPAVNDDVFLEYNSARGYNIAWNTRDFKLRNIASQISSIFGAYSKELRAKKLAPQPNADEILKALETAKDKRTPRQEELASEFGKLARVSNDEIYAALSQEDRERIDAIEKRLVGLFKNYGPPPMAPGVIDVGREAPRTYVAVRGNPEVPGAEVQPGYLTALGGGDVPEPPLHAATTFRRKHLAEWIASPDNPLTARVMVNRIWQLHFGEGLVATPSDFGLRAGKPSHPELLDWLAVRFVEQGWSVKAMHRMLMTSDAYQRSSVPSGEARAQDPENRLLSHFNRRRLQAEEIRDATLAASGELNRKMFGPPIVTPLDEEELYGITGNPNDRWVVTWDTKQHARRSVYLLQRRAFQQPMFQVFDAPDGMATCERRNESTTAPQSLTLLNSRFMVEQARSLAAKADAVDEAWQMAFGRDPSPEERDLAEAFVARQTTLTGSAEKARIELARSLLNSNEFLYVD